MNAETHLPRRRYLRIVGSAAAAAGLAGCSDDDSAGEPGTPSPTPEATASPGTPGTDELDLREANVVEVSVEETDGSYRFSVTLHHDDGGEPGYANWWQVEGLDGTRLGRRVLTHAHSDQPFTRSETIEVPNGHPCVVVRGHDETHGYGGQAILVDVDTGAHLVVGQGSEPTDFADVDCPE